jgi:hypothetical protein
VQQWTAVFRCGDGTFLQMHNPWNGISNYALSAQQFGEDVAKDRRDAYLLKAAELTALAENSRYAAFKKHFENLALAYWRNITTISISFTRHQCLQKMAITAKC